MQFTLAYSCVLFAAIFPYFFTVVAKTGKGFNNKIPREYLDSVTGFRKRAHWVQLNSFEAFPAFAVGVLIATQNVHQLFAINSLSVCFIIARILYSICYLANKDMLRSLFWGIGFLSTIGLYLIGIFSYFVFSS